jgi:MFS family permease
VLIGEIILYYGTMHGSLVVMACGLFLFGMGVSPLAVVQETLLARLSPGGHLGLSLALGLVSGKSASFISALISKPLAKAGGSGLPFFVALILCAVSFSANLARLAFKWGEPRTRHESVSSKRIVKWDGLSRLGDVFYVFIVV